MDLNQCLSILSKATSDNEKMAAMLVVSLHIFQNDQLSRFIALMQWDMQAAKLIKSGEIGNDDRRKIFNAVGFNFLNRLLVTSK